MTVKTIINQDSMDTLNEIYTIATRRNVKYLTNGMWFPINGDQISRVGQMVDLIRDSLTIQFSYWDSLGEVEYRTFIKERE